MRVPIIVLFLTMAIWPRAEAVESDSDANLFVIGLAAQRALEIKGFKFDGTIADSSIKLTSDFITLTGEQAAVYSEGEPSSVVRVGAIITIRKPASGATPFTINLTLEKQSPDGSWTGIGSRGVFERELVDSIKGLIERYRKSPSLN